MRVWPFLVPCALLACRGDRDAPPLVVGALAGARSGVLFAKHGEQTSTIQIDPLRPSTSELPDESEIELWLYGCDRDTLNPPSTGSSFPAPSGVGACSDEGAPCPLRAFGLSPGDSAWRSITAGKQPWAAGPRPSACLSFGPTREAELTQIDPASGGVSFMIGLGPDQVLTGGFDTAGPNGSFRSVLQVWAIPAGPIAALGPPIATATSAPYWMEAVARPDGSAMLVASDGRVAQLRLEGDHIRLTPEAAPFAASPPNCLNAAGELVEWDDMAMTGGPTAAGLELWVATTCRTLHHRVGDGPWTTLRDVAPGGRLVVDDGPGLYWIGPGEIYAAGLLESGILHVTGEVLVEEQLEGRRTTFTVGGTERGRIIASAADPDGVLIFEKLLERWTPLGATLAGSLYSVVGLDDGFLAGVGFGGAIMQFTADGPCSTDLQPVIPGSHLAVRLANVNDHVVALLRPRPLLARVDYSRLAVFDPIRSPRCDRAAE